jgi:hypothetical protein
MHRNANIFSLPRPPCLPSLIELGCGIDIGHAVNHRVSIEDDGRVSIDAVLHRLHQSLGSVLEFTTELGIHSLKSRQDQLFGIFRVTGKSSERTCCSWLMRSIT